MAWPFDPWNLQSRLKAPSLGPSWEEATRWWLEPVSRTSDALAARNEQLLAELAEGVIRRFEGQDVTFELGGRPLRALVDWIRLRRSDDRHDGRLELRDVEWDGWSFESVSVTAESVRVESWPSARVMVSGVELVGRTALEHLAAWLDPRLAPWSLRVDGAGRVEACRPDLALALTVEPVIEDGRVQVELRRVRWRRVRLALPVWLRWTRTLGLPALPGGLWIREARRVGGSVAFRATIPSFAQAIDLARVRDAVAQGTPFGRP